MTSMTTNTTKSFVAVTGLDGKLWYVDPSKLGQLPPPLEMAAFAGVTSSPEQTTIKDDLLVFNSGRVPQHHSLSQTVKEPEQDQLPQLR